VCVGVKRVGVRKPLGAKKTTWALPVSAKEIWHFIKRSMTHESAEVYIKL
jgi:hypothetical protein